MSDHLPLIEEIEQARSAISEAHARLKGVISKVRIGREGWAICTATESHRLFVVAGRSIIDVRNGLAGAIVKRNHVPLDSSEEEMLGLAWDAVWFIEYHELSEHFYFGDAKPFCNHNGFGNALGASTSAPNRPAPIPSQGKPDRTRAAGAGR
jgi:hypothetical protein